MPERYRSCMHRSSGWKKSIQCSCESIVRGTRILSKFTDSLSGSERSSQLRIRDGCRSAKQQAARTLAGTCRTADAIVMRVAQKTKRRRSVVGFKVYDPSFNTKRTNDSPEFIVKWVNLVTFQGIPTVKLTVEQQVCRVGHARSIEANRQSMQPRYCDTHC